MKGQERLIVCIVILGVEVERARKRAPERAANKWIFEIGNKFSDLTGCSEMADRTKAEVIPKLLSTIRTSSYGSELTYRCLKDASRDAWASSISRFDAHMSCPHSASRVSRCDSAALSGKAIEPESRLPREPA